MEAAFKDADIIYPKSWGPWMTTTDKDEAGKIIKQYESWICDERKMALAKEDAIYMHPLRLTATSKSRTRFGRTAVGGLSPKLRTRCTSPKR
jgi:ornithine carbamoyltransferase